MVCYYRKTRHHFGNIQISLLLFIFKTHFQLHIPYQLKYLYVCESSTADYPLENEQVIEDPKSPAGSDFQTPFCIPLMPCSLLCAISSVVSARNLLPNLHPPGWLTWLRCCGQGGADAHTWAQVPNLHPKAHQTPRASSPAAFRTRYCQQGR